MYNNIKNSVHLLGNVGKEIIITTFENGNKKASAMVATNQFFNNKNGDKVKKTDWHKIVAWGKTAENMASHLKKGSEVSIHGKLAGRSYTDVNGNTKYITEIVVTDFFKLSKKTVSQPEAVPF
jgi:single-strand DNA-binding protein